MKALKRISKIKISTLLMKKKRVMLNAVKIVRRHAIIRVLLVRDHCHSTGACRGAAHMHCSICWCCTNMFNILKGFDEHCIIKQAFEIYQQVGNKRITRIPNSNEHVYWYVLQNPWNCCCRGWFIRLFNEWFVWFECYIE